MSTIVDQFIEAIRAILRHASGRHVRARRPGCRLDRRAVRHGNAKLPSLPTPAPLVYQQR